MWTVCQVDWAESQPDPSDDRGDIIFDRVQAAEHWKSESDREQAIRIGAMFYDDIDWKYIRAICKKEGSGAMLDKVIEGVKDARKKI